MRPLIVPDTSVILKWVLAEEPAQEQKSALALLDNCLSGDIRLIVPSLWLYEAANILGRYKASKELIAALIALQLEEFDITNDEHWLDVALKLMADYKVSFYDATYHALAITRKGTFVTADKKYIQKVSGIGNISLLTQLTK